VTPTKARKIEIRKKVRGTVVALLSGQNVRVGERHVRMDREALAGIDLVSSEEDKIVESELATIIRVINALGEHA